MNDKLLELHSNRMISMFCEVEERIPMHGPRQHRLKVYESRVMRRIFGPNRREAQRGRKKLHDKELHNLYYNLLLLVIKFRTMR
jgi:hypothetical protein